MSWGMIKKNYKAFAESWCIKHILDHVNTKNDGKLSCFGISDMISEIKNSTGDC